MADRRKKTDDFDLFTASSSPRRHQSAAAGRPAMDGGPSGPMFQGGPSGPMFQGGPSGPMFQGGPSGPMFQGGPSGPMFSDDPINSVGNYGSPAPRKRKRSSGK